MEGVGDRACAASDFYPAVVGMDLNSFSIGVAMGITIVIGLDVSFFGNDLLSCSCGLCA